MSDYVMKPIDENTPKDREIILGFREYGTKWMGRWDNVAGEYLPKCRPDNQHAETTWERPDHWCDLPKWGS